MTNSVDPDQAASIGDFSRRQFQMHFFLGALRVEISITGDWLQVIVVKK